MFSEKYFQSRIELCELLKDILIKEKIDTDSLFKINDILQNNPSLAPELILYAFRFGKYLGKIEVLNKVKQMDIFS